MRSPDQFEHNMLVRAKTEVVAAALAHGVVPAHNVTLDLKNEDITRDDARRARYEFGFLRMWSIYPTQIKAIVAAMAPDYSEVMDAANILLAAQANDWGPIQYAGELHDRATYRYFWTLLQRAQVSQIEIPADAKAAFLFDLPPFMDMNGNKSTVLFFRLYHGFYFLKSRSLDPVQGGFDNILRRIDG
jgi:citrate lyase subunit beta/citryl-CoA lyase